MPSRKSEHPAGLRVLCLALMLGGCASLPIAIERPPSAAYAAPAGTQLGQSLAARTAAHPGLSGLRILDSGYEALAARLELVEAAERAIDVQYYIWHSDASGTLLAQRLLAAAGRGVRVRVLLDDINIGGRDRMLVALDSHPGIEIRIYNPSAGRSTGAKVAGMAREFGRLNRRMHNKSFVVDGAAGIVGGRNIGDEYFGVGEELGFRDRDLLAIGPVVPEISRSFDAYWNSPWAYPVSALAPGLSTADAAAARQELGQRPVAAELMPLQRQTLAQARKPFAGDLIWAPAELVSDDPTPTMDDHGQVGRVAAALGKLADATTSELLIESAYLVLDDAQHARVAGLTRRGVRVRALTNSLAANDVVANHASYAAQRKALLRSGAELHEYRPDAANCSELVDAHPRCGGASHYGLHAKSAVFDRKTLFVGSFNVNLRSRHLNFETALIVHSEELAAQLATAIEAGMALPSAWRVRLEADGSTLWSDGREEYRHDPQTSRWRRLKPRLIAWLLPDKYL